jgi:hypothetical protein
VHDLGKTVAIPGVNVMNFKTIFAENIGVINPKYSQVCKKVIITLGYEKIAHFCGRKLVKNSKNSDHTYSIDP